MRGRGSAMTTTESQVQHPAPEIAPGARIRDYVLRREGTVLETACQYPHPQARPIYQYLVRWDDGQVLAHSEGAFRRGGSLETVED